MLNGQRRPSFSAFLAHLYAHHFASRLFFGKNEGWRRNATNHLRLRGSVGLYSVRSPLRRCRIAAFAVGGFDVCRNHAMSRQGGGGPPEELSGNARRVKRGACR